MFEISPTEHPYPSAVAASQAESLFLFIRPKSLYTPSTGPRPGTEHRSQGLAMIKCHHAPDRIPQP